MEDFQEEQLSSLLIICPDRSEYDRQKIPVSSKRYKRECRYKTGYEGRLEYRGEGRQEYRCKVAAILLLFVLTRGCWQDAAEG